MQRIVTPKGEAVYTVCMGKTIRVPDPVAERIERIAERKDCAQGEVVRDWMEDSDELEQMERRL